MQMIIFIIDYITLLLSKPNFVEMLKVGENEVEKVKIVRGNLSSFLGNGINP